MIRATPSLKFNGILIVDNIETGSVIVWIDSQNIAFYISRFLDEVDLISMAENVQKIFPVFPMKEAYTNRRRADELVRES